MPFKMHKRLTRDQLMDGDSPEVLEGHLQLADGLGSSDVLTLLSLLALLYFLAH